MAQSKKSLDPVLTSTCPICTAPAEATFRPFCSRRCADVDLSRWLRGAYAIPVTEDDDEDGERTGFHPSDRPNTNERDEDGFQ